MKTEDVKYNVQLELPGMTTITFEGFTPLFDLGKLVTDILAADDLNNKKERPD